MATRTTRVYLDALAQRLNTLTGSPTQRFKALHSGEEGPLKHNVGHYHIDGANGGYSLVRTASEAGAEYTIIERRSAGALADLIRYYIQGINDALPAIAACRSIAEFKPDEAESDAAEADAFHAVKSAAVTALRGLAWGAA